MGVGRRKREEKKGGREGGMNKGHREVLRETVTERDLLL